MNDLRKEPHRTATVVLAAVWALGMVAIFNFATKDATWGIVITGAVVHVLMVGIVYWHRAQLKGDRK